MYDQRSTLTNPPHHPECCLTDPEQLATLVHQAVRAACPPALRHQAPDIAQTVLTRLVIRGRRSPRLVVTRGYAITAARNAVIDQLRAFQRDSTGRQALAAEREDAAPWDGDGLELRASRLGAELHRALAELPEGPRRALALYLTGHRLREIAELLEWTPKRADNVVFRTLGRLRAQLSPAPSPGQVAAS